MYIYNRKQVDTPHESSFWSKFSGGISEAGLKEIVIGAASLFPAREKRKEKHC